MPDRIPGGTLSKRYSTAAKNLLVYFHRRYFSDGSKPAAATNPYVIPEQVAEDYTARFCGNDYKQGFIKLKSMLSETGDSVPTLLKEYAELCEPGGVVFSDFSVDARFADCVDGFVIIDSEMIKSNKRRHYPGTQQVSCAEHLLGQSA